MKIILFFQYPLLIDWVSEWLLFNANSAIFQLYYGENKLIINEMMMRSATKDYKIGICCFSAKHAALRRKSKDWLARNQNNVSEWSDISTRGLRTFIGNGSSGGLRNYRHLFERQFWTNHTIFIRPTKKKLDFES
jgi:hypothetical protein